jgi:uncharacterized protein
VNDDIEQKYVEVPAEQLSSEALQGLIESFVLREGTDYGDADYNLDQKVNHVRRQLESGDVAVVFNVELQSADMLTRTEIKRLYQEMARDGEHPPDEF